MQPDPLIAALSALVIDELSRLAASPDVSDDNDYARLARQIMGARTSKREPGGDR